VKKDRELNESVNTSSTSDGACRVAYQIGNDNEVDGQ